MKETDEAQNFPVFWPGTARSVWDWSTPTTASISYLNPKNGASNWIIVFVIVDTIGQILFISFLGFDLMDNSAQEGERGEHLGTSVLIRRIDRVQGQEGLGEVAGSSGSRGRGRSEGERRESSHGSVNALEGNGVVGRRDTSGDEFEEGNIDVQVAFACGVHRGIEIDGRLGVLQAGSEADQRRIERKLVAVSLRVESACGGPRKEPPGGKRIQKLLLGLALTKGDHILL